MNEIFLVGDIMDAPDEITRTMVVDRCYTDMYQIITDTFYIRYWTRKPKSHFMQIEKGHCIAIRGRIEQDPVYNYIIIVEAYMSVPRLKAFKEL